MSSRSISSTTGRKSKESGENLEELASQGAKRHTHERSFSISNLFKKKEKIQTVGKADTLRSYKINTLTRSSPNLTPRTSGDSSRSPSEDIPPFTLSNTESKKIVHKLDELALKSQNPLFGLESDSENEEHEESTPQKPTFSGNQQLLALFPDDTFEERHVMTRTIDTIFKLAKKGASQEWTVEMLPLVAAVWYPPSVWPENSESVFDRENYLLPEEEMIIALEKEMKKVEALLTKKQTQLKMLLQEDLQIDLDLIDKEVKKRRDAIRLLEYKQWKLLSTIEGSQERTVAKENKKDEQVIIVDKDENSNVIREIRIKDGEQSIQAGTMESLILSLFDDSNKDLKYLDDFLLAYRLYLNSPSLLQQIIDMFEKGSIRKASSLRVALFLKKWVQKYWKVDFQLEDIEKKLENFWKVLSPLVKPEVDFEISILFRVSSNQEEANNISYQSLTAHPKKKEKDPSLELNREQDLALDSNQDSSLGSFLQVSRNIEELAAILCCIELQLYQTIRPEEFLEKLIWKGGMEELNEKTKYLFSLIDWANQLGYWMATEICLCYDLKDRIRILTKFIELARECTKYGCYNTVFAIVTGLSNSSIARLKQTWSGLQKKVQSDFNELEELCNPQFNYKKYRKLEQEIHPPFIPFLGMHMRDQFFLNDGNPSKLPNGLMSFDKLRGLIKSINYVLSFQTKTSIACPIKSEKLKEYILYVNAVEPLHDRHLHKLSCQCEPPEWRKRTNFSRRADDLNLI